MLTPHAYFVSTIATCDTKDAAVCFVFVLFPVACMFLQLPRPSWKRATGITVGNRSGRTERGIFRGWAKLDSSGDVKYYSPGRLSCRSKEQGKCVVSASGKGIPFKAVTLEERDLHLNLAKCTSGLRGMSVCISISTRTTFRIFYFF